VCVIITPADDQVEISAIMFPHICIARIKPRSSGPPSRKAARKDDTLPQKDADVAFVAVSKNLENVDWWIYEPIDTMKLFNDDADTVDPEQAHWDTIPLEWPADEPMRIQLPVGCNVCPVCTVPAPCTLRNILQSIYDFYQVPITTCDLDDLGIKLDRRTKDRLHEVHPPRRFHLQGSTELKFGMNAPEGERRHPLSCM
jgi:hypothetical protein